MKKNLFVLLITTSIVLASCNLGVPAPQDDSAIATAAAQTVAAVLASPATSPTAPVLATPEASPIPGVAIDGTTAEPPSTDCEENYVIVKWERDGVTYDKKESDKPLNPDQGFVMSWTIRNTGNCIWTDGYKMVYDSGEHITPTDSFPAIAQGLSIPPGSELILDVPMAAPSKSGSYETTFRMDNAKNERVLFVGVLTTVGMKPSMVNGLAAPSDLRYTYDCSGGIIRIGLTWKDNADNESGYRIYRNGTLVATISAGATSYDDIAPAPGAYQYVVAAFNPDGESTNQMYVETSNCK